MAHIIYSDERQPFAGKPIPYESQPATTYYLNHFNNYLFLNAIVKAPKDPWEKRRALKELTVCERKLEYWRRHPNFDMSHATTEAQRLKTMWSQ